ncbi:3,4-dihydroxy-2-butanone-4-phosphate synthase [Pseudomonas capeferrum]|uniref:3,4-dihydroxy-2-butanone-4-phosphate synthase n=1 Tax=Pseudomonas capeferrum TaxID=1495066 RepID=UPI0015E2E012|nr:3,4-dihydroxy-2-butanone-4-phosphate synthase [Pseudomonas capeferrum]MBA1203084.1 3,4-dihydroxy-2-butanone-4-phosphate synthase [Pseudomonas capeferrum]
MSPSHYQRFPRIAAAIAAFQAGKPVLLLDDDDREDEADIIAAAENLSLQTMAMMIRDCSGIVCLCLDEATVDALQLAPMVKDNQARHGTGFTVTIEAAEGVSTGVSAQDRITTIEAALRSTAEQRHIVSPGHVFPLRARDGGVLTRRGHTEGSVDLARLAGLRPAAVLCELMNPDGSMARGEQVAVYAREYNLPMLTIDELARYRTAVLEERAMPA